MPPPRTKLLPILLTALVAFGPISTDLYLPSLPALTRAFGAEATTVQLTLSVFLAGFAASQLVYGPLSDRFGRRPVLLAGVALYLAASIGCALAPSIEALIVGRFFQALGACCGPVLGRAVVRDLYGREQAARMLAYIATAMALAPAIGPILGGYLTVWLGWRSNFWLLAGFGALVLASAALLLGETNRHRDPLATRPARLAANYLSLVRHRGYVGYALIVASVYSGIFAFISGSPHLFIDALGLSPDRYGMCFAAVVIGYMAGTFGAGRLTLRLGIDRMIAIGAVLALAGGLAMALFAVAGWLSVATVVAPFSLFMAGAGVILPNALAGGVGPFPTMAGAASALMGFVQMAVAAAVGIAVARFADGTAAPMAVAVLAVAAAAGVAFLTLVRPARRTAGPRRPSAAAPGGPA